MRSGNCTTIALLSSFRQLHEERLIRLPAPSVAANAADQPFAVMIDFNERAIAPSAVAKVMH
jgi:hypothetical protein